LLLCFYPALARGSSGQLLDDFDPAKGALVYMENPQPYVFAALICLNADESQFAAGVDGEVKRVTYQQATEALSRFIQVAPDAVSGEEATHVA
jgi:hypothetical protein